MMKHLCVQLAVLCLCASVYADGKKATFEALSRAKHLYGPKITPKDLKGKVVFLEYWGINCPPCRASFPHLVKMQAKYEQTGKFTVLASHRQSDFNGAKKFCQKQKTNFPVVHMFGEPAAPCGRGIPYAALIDHKGNVVKTGSPFSMMKDVGKLVKNTPEFNPIIGDIELKHWKSSAKSIRLGYPVKRTLNSLKKASANNDAKGQEAKQIVEAVENYLETTKTELILLVETSPSEALSKLESFSKTVQGIESMKDASVLYNKLKKDNSVASLVKLRKSYERLAEKLGKKRTKSLERELEWLKKKLQKLIAAKQTSDIVRKEAQQFYESIL